MINDSIAGNLVQPAFDLLFFLKLVYVALNLHENVLQDVLGIFVMNALPDKGKQLAAIGVPYVFNGIHRSKSTINCIGSLLRDAKTFLVHMIIRNT